MGCGCKKKKVNRIQKPVKSVKKQARTDGKRHIEDMNVDVIVKVFNAIMPAFIEFSENDLDCIECIRKHLANATAYISEAHVEEYRLNIFRAIGQIGVAEIHARKWKDLSDALRNERLALMRDGKEPEWDTLIDMLDRLES